MRLIDRRLLKLIREQQRQLVWWQKQTLEAKRDLQATIAAVMIADSQGETLEWDGLLRTVSDEVARLEEHIA